MSMTYDYFTINFTSVVGILFLTIFLYANSTLDEKIKRYFYATILLEAAEALVYSLELWTSTFEELSLLRPLFSAIGYSVRPYIFCMILSLVMRNVAGKKKFSLIYLPATINVIASYSVFFTDFVYSYTANNEFVRGPLGYISHAIVVLYMLVLIAVVIEYYTDLTSLEPMIIFAITLLLLFSMAIEAAFGIRTIGRASMILATIFYYMFFQTQDHRAKITKEQGIRQQLEYNTRFDRSTGVMNKQAFYTAAKELLSEENKENLQRVGFLFVDLDYLKDVNDKLGHTTGDIAICDAARTIREVFGETDLIGRFGGDEFCVLQPNVSAGEFRDRMVTLQERMIRQYHGNNVTVTVTASMGGIYAEGTAVPCFEELVYRSDEAMYEAKSGGRNRHVIRTL